MWIAQTPTFHSHTASRALSRFSASMHTSTSLAVSAVAASNPTPGHVQMWCARNDWLPLTSTCVGKQITHRRCHRRWNEHHHHATRARHNERTHNTRISLPSTRQVEIVLMGGWVKKDANKSEWLHHPTASHPHPLCAQWLSKRNPPPPVDWLDSSWFVLVLCRKGDA